MKLFLDTADVKSVKARLSTGLISGITTNPTLIFKSGRHPQEVYWDLIKLGIKDEVNVKFENLSLEWRKRLSNKFKYVNDYRKNQIDWLTRTTNQSFPFPCNSKRSTQRNGT